MTTPSFKPSFQSLTRETLASWVSERLDMSPASGAIRAEALFIEIYGRKKRSFENLTELSKRLREELDVSFSTGFCASVAEISRSPADSSVKLALRLMDGELIETVLIPERGRLTICLSTEVGCAQACRFCATGRMGLRRRLTQAEIVDQVLVAENWRATSPECPELLRDYERATNLVFMGMGEPLDNVDAVLGAIDVFTDTSGLRFSPNKVTVSSVGLLPELDRLLASSNVGFALSLHSPIESERSRIMPVNDRFPLAAVIESLRRAQAARPKRCFLIQYTMIRGVNDSPAHADALCALLEGLQVKVNLIPLNEHEGAGFRRPGLEDVYRFQQHLKAKGLIATVRLSKGRDIQAACGQLVVGRHSKAQVSRAETKNPDGHTEVYKVDLVTPV